MVISVINSLIMELYWPHNFTSFSSTLILSARALSAKKNFFLMEEGAFNTLTAKKT